MLICLPLYRPQSAVFSPLSLSPLLWLDERGRENSGAAAVVGDAVSQWSDQSGNDNHLTQTTAEMRPQVTEGGVAFDGSNKLAGGATLANIETLFIVGSRTHYSQCFGQINEQGSHRGFFGYAAPTYTNFSSCEVNGTDVGIMVNSSLWVYMTDVAIWTGYTNIAANNSMERAQWVLGEGYPGYGNLVGVVKEVVAFPQVLPPQERAQVTQYLAAKHAIEIA